MPNFWGEPDDDLDMPDWMKASTYQNGGQPKKKFGKSLEEVAAEALKKPPVPQLPDEDRRAPDFFDNHQNYFCLTYCFWYVMLNRAWDRHNFWTFREIIMSNELINIKDFILKFKGWWAASLGIVIALILGIAIGILIVESKIINDCKFLSAFRIGDQGYTCQRRI